LEEDVDDVEDDAEDVDVDDEEMDVVEDAESECTEKCKAVTQMATCRSSP
jgi:hypothetical protein